jgi:hypothetical protein
MYLFLNIVYVTTIQSNIYVVMKKSLLLWEMKKLYY